MNLSAVSQITPSPISGPSPINVRQEGAMSKTDWKTHTVVVLSYLLIAIGIALACASLFLTTVVHPMIAFGSPVATITLGTVTLQVVTGTEKTPIPGQPLGLENASQNCWANALTQFCQVPGMRKILMDLPEDKFKPLSASLDTYMKERYAEDHKTVSSVDSQKLRLWARGYVKEISTSAKDPEDPMPILNVILEHSSMPPIEVEQTYTRFAPGKTEPSSTSVTIQKDHRHIDLQLASFKNGSTIPPKQLFANYFEDQSSTDTGERSVITKRILAPPQDLILCVQQGAGDVRYNSEVNWTLDLREIPGAIYDCDGFIIQRGGINSGHYTACIKDSSGQWWHCNDEKVTKISFRDAQRRMRKAYILHFDKRA